MRQGEVVFSPISHTHPIAEQGGLPKGWDFWEAFDRVYLGVSRRIVVLCIDGWKESVGVTAELRIANDLGVPVFHLLPYGDSYRLICLSDKEPSDV